MTALIMGGLILSGGMQRLSAVFSMPETKRYCLFFVIMVLGIPFAYHRRVAFEYIFLTYSINILFFLILVAEVNSRERLKSLVWIICLSAFLYGFYGFKEGYSYLGRFQIYGGMFDSNDIAGVLLSTFPICIFYLFHRESLFKTVVALIAVLSSVMVILMTGSRGGFLGFAAVIAMVLCTKTGGVKRIHKLMFLVALSAVVLFLGDRINTERYWSLTDLSSDYNVTGEEGRKQIWSRAIDLILGHPFTGVGVDCFPMAIGGVRSTLGILPKWQGAHNSYLQVASEVGLFGFIAFVSLSFITFRTLVRASRITAGSAEARQVRTLAGLMFLAFLGHSVTAFFLSQGYSIFFTLFFALAAIIRRLLISVVHERNDISRAAFRTRETPLSINRSRTFVAAKRSFGTNRRLHRNTMTSGYDK
ncbi:MAG: O-antigen ligase family protein [Gammaproteobacteria bacterium]